MSSLLLSRALIAGSHLVQNGNIFIPVTHTAACSGVLLRPSLLGAGPSCPTPLLLPLVAHLHTSQVLERARQSTRIKKRKVALDNKKKKEERLRKNPPPLPKKIQLMLIAKGLGELCATGIEKMFDLVC
jgi:hypothetical protein